MESPQNDIWLQTRSRVVQKAVSDSLSSLGVAVHVDDQSGIRLKIVHISGADDLSLLQTNALDARPLVVLIDANAGVPESAIGEFAVGVLVLPFLSNELRTVVGRILSVSISDSEIYERADRPIPVVVNRKPILETDMEVTMPPRPPSLPTKRTLRTDELPPIDTFADMPQVSFSESLPPLPQPPEPSQGSDEVIEQTTINTISAEYIEKVVWEVVPKLAERILREEIARLLDEKFSGS